MRVRGVAVAFSLLLAGALALSACATTNKTSSGSAGQGTGSAGGPIPGSQEDLVVNVGDRVFFDYNEYALKDEGRATLQRQAAWMKKYPSVVVQVEGHCDERGTREYNLALGERRANSVKNYLVALGVDANRLQTISYGKERPAVEGHDDASFAQNRRGVTVLMQ